MSSGAGERREDDMATIAWPGFVDILSSVIIMFVFFVMVITIVLYIYTINFTAQIEETAIEQAVQSIEQQEQENLEKKKALLADIEALREQREEIVEGIEELEREFNQTAQGFSDAETQNLIMDENSIVVLYEVNSVTLSDEAIEKIEEFLQRYDVQNTDLLIEAGDAPDRINVLNSRRQNLGRILNVRNIALSYGYESDSIEFKYVNAENINGSYNWVRLKVQ